MTASLCDPFGIFLFFFFFFTSSLFSTSILSRSTIFLRGLKNLSGSRGNMAHATGCNAIKIHEAWKTRLARDFARLCSWITALSRVLRDLCSGRGYQNNWIPREFVIYKQPLNVSIPPPSLPLSFSLFLSPIISRIIFFCRVIYFYKSNWFLGHICPKNRRYKSDWEIAKFAMERDNTNRYLVKYRAVQLSNGREKNERCS